uniref:Uncharacterized protein n=1 Tax=uncultured Cytophagia bacterium TaxID=768505 RepID=F4MN96_9BACT|nr:hypothetical protein S18_1001_0008 [uncultured Cytophagia bacterium]
MIHCFDKNISEKYLLNKGYYPESNFIERGSMQTHWIIFLYV